MAAALICGPPLGVAGSFTSGNLVVLQAASNTANNTTCSLIEINTTTANQSAVQTVAISGSGASALRISGSAKSVGYLANSDDGTLVAFTGANNVETSTNVDTLNPRGVGTLDIAGSFALRTTYTGTTTSGGNQTRGASSFNNSNWFIGDENGIYTNNGTPSTRLNGNFRAIKSFGNTLYVFVNSSTAPAVARISTSPVATNYLSGVAPEDAGQDFYMISSGNNGATFDVLYIVASTSASAGTIKKYSLVSGSWTANGSYTTTFGGFGVCAARSGSGAVLYVTTGTGANGANSVVKLTDTAGYNSAINITTANNVTLFTTAAGTNLKGIAFAPTIPIISTQPANVTACSGSTATFSVTAVGSGALIYSWIKTNNSGWGSAWTFSGNGGLFRGTSTGNEAGGGVCTSLSSAYDINSSSGNALGMFCGGGTESAAVRSFTALTNGQVVSIDVDNGDVNSGKKVGFSLQTSGGTDQLQFYYLGFSGYKYNDGTERDTGIGFQRTGLRVQFVLTSSSTYTLIVTPCGGTTKYFSGSFSGGSIARLKLFNQNSSGGNDYNVYFNNLIVGGYVDHADNYSGDWGGQDKGDVAIASGNGSSSYTTPTLTTSDSGAKYEVVVSGAGGAVLSSVATLTVNSTPSAPSTTGASRCGSGSVTLTASGSGGTLKWYSDAGLTTQVATGGSYSPTVSSTTTFYVTETSAAGCVSSAATVTATVNPLPGTSAITGNSLVQANDSGVTYSVTLTSGSTYAWTVPSGATITSGGSGPNNNSIAVTFGATSGDVTVTETSSAGCAGSVVTKSVTVNRPPTAANASYSCSPGLSTIIRITGSGGIASDPDGNSLSITAGTPSSGIASVLTIGGSKYIFYSNTVNTATSDSFGYTASDGVGGSANGTIIININVPTGQSQGTLSAESLNGGGVRVKLLGIPNYKYALEWTDSLAEPVTWTPLQTNTASDNGLLTFTNNAPGSQNFYRTRWVP